VVGNVNGGTGFVDDFNDGCLATPPTSNINCNLNTAPVAESAGFLVLTSRDGANTFTPGALVDNCFLGLDATAYRFNKGSGGATITASFRADAPLPAQAYGLQLFTLGTNELVSIFVTNNGFLRKRDKPGRPDHGGVWRWREWREHARLSAESLADAAR
jgi:hypothetical protein